MLLPTMDRYILRLFVKYLAVSLLGLTSLFIVADLFSHLDEFLPVAERRDGFLPLVGEYYGPRILTFFERTSGLLVLLAAALVATMMQRANELTALMAAGIEKIRVMQPLLIGAVCVSLLAAACRETLIPQFRDRLLRDIKDWEGAKEQKLQPRFDARTDILIGGEATQAADQHVLRPLFKLPTVMGGFGTQVAARDAYYCRRHAGWPAGYLLKGVEHPARPAEIPSFYVDEQPVLLSPQDTPGLAADEMFVVSDVTFDQLATGSQWRQFAGTPELIAALHNPSMDCGADLRVTVHTRLVQPLLDMTLLFLGLPLVVAREQRNVFVAAGLCILVVALYYLVVLTCQALGTNYLLSPALAAWCPLLIFVPIARLTAVWLWR